jgi:hypothetical protein
MLFADGAASRLAFTAWAIRKIVLLDGKTVTVALAGAGISAHSAAPRLPTARTRRRPLASPAEP